MKTLLIEDSLVIRETLMPAMAEMANAHFLGIAETGEDAILLLQVHSDEWSLAVVDLFLRQGSGLDVLAACQRRNPGQKVVVLTNYPTPAMRARCSFLGADALFDKSTELEEFLTFCSDLK